jgi:hypothetical protein
VVAASGPDERGRPLRRHLACLSAGAPHPAVAAHGASSGAPGAPLLILLRSRLFDGNAVTFCLTYGVTVANLTGVCGGHGEREHQKNNSSNQFHIFSPESLARICVKQEMAREAAN